jgi:hypothetical protein
MTTFQGRRPGGLLGEWFGGLELRFHLEVNRGALVYRQVRAYLRTPLVAAPLPRWCSPQVAAREEPTGAAGRTRVEVRVALPLMGLVLTYGGELELETEDSCKLPCGC